ncbi:MAG: M24 family metallopeptidase [Deltaproteobacteria bacterium]
MTHTSHRERLASLRARMQSEGLDLYVVRGTDRFLNEYVPTAESTRVWLTGFSGSTGDALVGLDAAWMFVDGRYDLQARKELEGGDWGVEVIPLGIALEKALAERCVERSRKAPVRVGYEPDRFSLELLGRFHEWMADGSVTLVPSERSLVEHVRGEIAESRGTVRALDEAAVGRTVGEKIESVRGWLAEHRATALLVQRLDELAYVTNLRGDELPFQATFRSAALVTAKDVVLAVDLAKVPEAVRAARPSIRFVEERAFADALRALGAGAVVAVDAAGTTAAMRTLIEQCSAKVITRTSPFTAMKAKKTPAELRAMRSAFQRADRVVAAAQRWLIEQVVSGARVTETGFAEQVEKMFRASGAVGLSFNVISACGENAAVVHHPPDATRVIGRGEMMLLDTGAYYAEGYATDLTRTFFVGGPDDRPTADMKKWFTLTLKSAIAGMTARVPRSANGAQLDGICRSPLWAAGMEYAHGTGHGVGINVHESPPRVASVSLLRLEEGQVFSIEPGVYVAGRGGVRIENLCTVVPDPEDASFLRVQPMTFSPLDARLIDDARLTGSEREFLASFAKGYEP